MGKHRKKREGNPAGRKPGQGRTAAGRKSAPKRHTMTPKQAKFAREYLKDSNATQAAIRAGYSPRSAAATGGRLLQHARIKSFIAEAIDKANDEATADLTRWLVEVRRLALFDSRKLFDENDNPRPPSEWDDDVAAAIASFDHEIRTEADECAITRLRKVRTHSKVQALDMWGRQLGAVRDEVTVNVIDLTGAKE
jgi:phage terminase small subunit